nr:DUF6514 family protein [uncultured Oscillibacter sp.]
MDNYYQYIMISSLKYATGIGTYASYDIAAFDIFHRRIDDIVFDVTADRNKALRIIEKFNRYQLSPIHLEEAILDAIV